MQGSEKLCLQWNDFKENAALAFGELRNKSEFSDVTLVSQDGEKIEAHKMMLASSSPLFMELLSQNKHLHPLIYMRGLKSDVLVALLDFLYFGEANIWQEELDDFLSLAAELKLKGLGGDEKKTAGTSSKPKTSQVKSEKETPHEGLSSVETSIQTQLDPFTFSNTEVEKAETENSEDVEAQIRSMISGSEESLRSAGISGNGYVYTCKVCGKRGENSNIKRHVESNHIAREAQCKICGRTASSGHSLGRQTCLVDGGRCKSRRYGVSQNYKRH